MKSPCSFLKEMGAGLFLFSLLGVHPSRSEQTLPHSPVSMSVEQLKALAKQGELWKDPVWQKLLHYKKSIWGGYESEADGLDFFLHPKGKTHPQEELLQEVETLVGDTSMAKDIDQSARCRFPARRQFLIKRLGVESSFDNFKDCPKFINFWNVTRPKSVSVVFSSYYLANPASAFGHSFLRLNRYPVPAPKVLENPKILDLGVNYAAVVNTNNPLLYGWGGMFGGFRGVFNTTPYYMKVREYADFESRDLWEYDLSLSEEETKFLVMHIWELDSTYFDYYFLFENCSYHSLTALDVVRPDLNLEDLVPFYVIPVDTIKALFKVPGLVHEVNFRPSLRSQFEARKAMVPGNYQSWILKIQKKPELTQDQKFKELDPLLRAQILDAALEYYDSKNQEVIQQRTRPEILKHRAQLLGARAQESATTGDIKVEAPEHSAPHKGHDSLRWGLGFRDSRAQAARMTAEIRFALHDILDPPQGYAPFSTLEFFDLKTSFNKNEFAVDEFRVVQAESFIPFTSFHHDKSYSVKLAYADFSKTQLCEKCSAAFFEGAWGLSASLHSYLKSYLMGAGDFMLGPASRHLGKVTVGVGPRAGFLWNTPRVGAVLDFSYKYRPFHDYDFYYSQRAALSFHFSKSLSVELEESILESSKTRWKFNLYHYF